MEKLDNDLIYNIVKEEFSKKNETIPTDIADKLFYAKIYAAFLALNLKAREEAFLEVGSPIYESVTEYMRNQGYDIKLLTYDHIMIDKLRTDNQYFGQLIANKDDFKIEYLKEARRIITMPLENFDTLILSGVPSFSDETANIFMNAATYKRWYHIVTGFCTSQDDVMLEQKLDFYTNLKNRAESINDDACIFDNKVLTRDNTVVYTLEYKPLKHPYASQK